MQGLTDKQQNILNIINDYISSFGYPPSFRDIGERAQLASSSTVHRHLENLKKKGYVSWEPTQPRTLTVIKHEEFTS
jgi:SOS-response transcriptional repressor LexA